MLTTAGPEQQPIEARRHDREDANNVETPGSEQMFKNSRTSATSEG
jgi:hypothetical protein